MSIKDFYFVDVKYASNISPVPVITIYLFILYVLIYILQMFKSIFITTSKLSNTSMYFGKL